MRIFLFIGLTLIFFRWSACGTEALVMFSPDQSFTVMTDPESSETRGDRFGIALCDSLGEREIAKLPGVFRVRDDYFDYMRWHPTEHVLGIIVSDSRRISHLELFKVTDGSVARIPVPDYKQAALELVGAHRTENTHFGHIMGWHGNLLIMEWKFNARSGETGEFQGFYSCTVAFRYDPKTSTVKIDGISDPVEK